LFVQFLVFLFVVTFVGKCSGATKGETRVATNGALTLGFGLL